MDLTRPLVQKVLESQFARTIFEEHRVALDNTTFSTWNSCFMKGVWYGALRRVPSKPRTPLIFGASVHLALAKHLEGASVDEAIKVAIEDAIKNKLDSALDPKRNTDTLRLLLTSYFEHITLFPADRLTPLTLDGVPVVEKDFSVPIGSVLLHDTDVVEDREVSVSWNGIIDLVGYSGGSLWVIDHKTTSIMGEKFADDKMRSSQMLGYFLVISKLLSERTDLPQLSGCLINALAMYKSSYEFKQFKLPLTAAKAAEFQRETLNNVSRIVKELYRMRNWFSWPNGGQVYSVPSCRDSCVHKYGRCDYFDLCEAPLVIRERLAYDEGFYTATKWNPGEEGHE
jgi:hypothetical protein